MAAGSIIGRTMRYKICEGIFLADQTGEFGKRIFCTAYTPC